MAKRSIDEASRLAKEIKKTREWHHDIRLINGKFVEAVVKEYQETNSEDLIKKIIDNYGIFKARWGRLFAPFLDGDTEDGELMHDNIVWRSASKFKLSKARKSNGKSFNAYLVSALLNQLKNLRNAGMSFKNHPRAKCPICGEQVYQIDQKHLEHRINLKRYKKMFPTYPLVSYDGMTRCPIFGTDIEEVTFPYLNRMAGRYTVQDFWQEFPELRVSGPYTCPLTGTKLRKVTEEYLSGLLDGYTMEEFVKDFPNFPGIIDCQIECFPPTTEVTQEYLDKCLEQTGANMRFTNARFEKEFPNFTRKARQVPVVNPYTGKEVLEITPIALAQAGTNVKEHLNAHAGLILDRSYYELIYCPFTGRRTHMIKQADLEKLGRSVQEFYQATNKYPLRKYQVKCAICGEWVDNIWEHLADVSHCYAPVIPMEEFEKNYGLSAIKKTVSTNSFVESDSGDSIHIADLFNIKESTSDALEVEDSLAQVSQDDLDKRIAHSVRDAQTLEDIYHLSAKIILVPLPFEYKQGMLKEVRELVAREIQDHDFDLLAPPARGAEEVDVMIPSRQTIRQRLRRMICESDLGDGDLEAGE